MSTPTITLTYPFRDGVRSYSVEVRRPDWGEVDEQDPGQTTARTLGGRLVVARMGRRVRRLTLSWRHLDSDERIALSEFFSADRADGAAGWWYLDAPLDLPGVAQVGAAVLGVTLTAGSFAAGAETRQDSRRLRCRLSDPVVAFQAARDEPYSRHDPTGHRVARWAFTMPLEIEPDHEAPRPQPN